MRHPLAEIKDVFSFTLGRKGTSITHNRCSRKPDWQQQLTNIKVNPVVMRVVLGFTGSGTEVHEGLFVILATKSCRYHDESF